MPLFGPPNIQKLQARGDVEGLIKALLYRLNAESGSDYVCKLALCAWELPRRWDSWATRAPLTR